MPLAMGMTMAGLEANSALKEHAPKESFSDQSYYILDDNLSSAHIARPSYTLITMQELLENWNGISKQLMTLPSLRGLTSFTDLNLVKELFNSQPHEIVVFDDKGNGFDIKNIKTNEILNHLKSSSSNHSGIDFSESQNDIFHWQIKTNKV